MLAEKEPVTFTAVARAAKVSHWLVYAPGVREVIEQAQRRQARQPREDGVRKAPAGRQVDVRITREDNRRLREDVDRLKAAVRRSLGHQIDQVGAADLGARVDELTAANQSLEWELAQERARAAQLQTRLTETQDVLAGARTSLRCMIRSGNQEPAV